LHPKDRGAIFGLRLHPLNLMQVMLTQEIICFSDFSFSFFAVYNGVPFFG